MSNLRWNLRHRSDGSDDEFATDENGRPCFLIERTISGWELCIPYSFTVDPFPVERIQWECVWCFRSKEQARREAEIRYDNRAIYDLKNVHE